MIVSLLLVVPAHATVVLEAPARVGDETVIAVTNADGDPRAGETVRVIHRPRLSGEREMAIGITDGRGRVRWTPEAAGIARIRAGEEPFDVTVAWAAPPPAVPILLGLVLLGGTVAAGYGFGLGARR